MKFKIQQTRNGVVLREYLVDAPLTDDGWVVKLPDNLTGKLGSTDEIKLTPAGRS